MKNKNKKKLTLAEIKAQAKEIILKAEDLIGGGCQNGCHPTDLAVNKSSGIGGDAC